MAWEFVDSTIINLHFEFNMDRYLRYILYKLRANHCEERSVFWKGRKTSQTRYTIRHYRV